MNIASISFSGATPLPLHLQGRTHAVEYTPKYSRGDQVCFGTKFPVSDAQEVRKLYRTLAPTLSDKELDAYVTVENLWRATTPETLPADPVAYLRSIEARHNIFVFVDGRSERLNAFSQAYGGSAAAGTSGEPLIIVGEGAEKNWGALSHELVHALHLQNPETAFPTAALLSIEAVSNIYSRVVIPLVTQFPIPPELDPNKKESANLKQMTTEQLMQARKSFLSEWAAYRLGGELSKQEAMSDSPDRFTKGRWMISAGIAVSVFATLVRLVNQQLASNPITTT